MAVIVFVIFAVNHEYVQALFQGANDAVITSDLNWRVVLRNPGAEQLFECEGGEMVGQPLDHLIPINWPSTRGRAGAYQVFKGRAGVGLQHRAAY